MMIDQALIDQIIAKVISRVRGKLIANTPPQQVLMLFSGASTGYVVGMETIRLLSGAQHKLTVGLTASALHVIGADKVRQAGASDIITPNQWVNTPGLVRAADLVLLPTLSMNTAAHLALGLMDSLFSTLVLGALLADKPVIAVCDGADPYGNGGLVFSDNHNGAPTLRRKMVENLDTLMAYGVQLVREEAFIAAVTRQLQGNQPAAAPLARVTWVGNGRHPIITDADLSAITPGTTLRLPPGARLTPLAQDTARRRDLRLMWEGIRET